MHPRLSPHLAWGDRPCYPARMAAPDMVLIADFGSQYTQLIARRIRELGVYCEIVACTDAWAAIERAKPKALVLSGGPASVYAEGAPTIDTRIFDLGLPVLGICYGVQLMTHLLGGKVERANEREYGAATIRIHDHRGFFARIAPESELGVWMSHGDRIASIAPGFEVTAVSDNSPFAAIANHARKLYGVQFHPEVVHTKRGKDLLAAFVHDVAGMAATWTPESFVESSIERIKEQIGPTGHAICGLSGGVDSSVAAVLVHRAIGDRLTCIFVDNGLLRRGEAEEVVTTFRDAFGMKLVAVDARKRFMDALDGVQDPEQKRKIIGRVFIEVFEDEAKKVQDAGFLVQGTLYPDVIESVSFKGPSVVIKSHHNVGGLPERMRMALCEPLRELFKDEVRAAGRKMGIPQHILGRHPFPGPGLAIRCLGDLNEKRLDVLRAADAIFLEELRKAGLYDTIWQAFAVLLPVRSVGVMGDERSYDEVCALRAVTSVDGMTADWAAVPYEVLASASSRIINEVKGIGRVVYDISSKPPATIEWE
jgi:GMP synthase (glutamine-hydrolysing)